MKEEQLLSLFPGELRGRLHKAAGLYEGLQEIRLAANMPARIIWNGREFYLQRNGEIAAVKGEDAWLVKPEELDAVLKHVCSYSRYAYEEDIRQGFITVPGGHRIGVAGQVVLGENGRVKSMRYIRGMNIRIAHEIIGAAKKAVPFLYEKGEFQNTLLVGPPGCGKTTLLRDLIRELSTGALDTEMPRRGLQVGVVDERSEIAGSYRGIAENDLGIRCDVLDACPKAQGMMMLLRSMNPEVIAVDEIGSREDMEAVLEVQKCGCRILATLHAASLEEAAERLSKKDLFQRYVLLGKKEGKCILNKITDQKGVKISA